MLSSETADGASLSKTPLSSVRRLQEVDREYRQFELRREIAEIAREEQRMAAKLKAAMRVSFCSKLHKIIWHTDHRGRFIYQNGWMSTTNRRVACKESDPYWGMSRAAQYGTGRMSYNSGFTVFATLFLLCAVMALSANLIPKK